jgi:adenine-specific DNA-methyltransferase
MTAREEARRVVGCRVPAELAESDAGYFAENHINIICPQPHAQMDLDAVLGLLNSRLFDYVFRALNGNTNVSATELELLPVVDGAAMDAVADAARALTAAGGKDRALLRELNAAVYDLYDIEAGDIAELEGTAELLVA